MNRMSRELKSPESEDNSAYAELAKHIVIQAAWVMSIVGRLLIAFNVDRNDPHIHIPKGS